MRTLLLTVALLVILPGTVEAADILINNGMAPPWPENVIDHDLYWYDNVYVRDAGCGVPDPNGPCSWPGYPTT